MGGRGSGPAWAPSHRASGTMAECPARFIQVEKSKEIRNSVSMRGNGAVWQGEIATGANGGICGAIPIPTGRAPGSGSPMPSAKAGAAPGNPFGNQFMKCTGSAEIAEALRNRGVCDGINGMAATGRKKILTKAPRIGQVNNHSFWFNDKPCIFSVFALKRPSGDPTP